MLFTPILCCVLFIPPKATPEPPRRDPIAESIAHFPPDDICRIWIEFGEQHAGFIEDKIKGGLVAADKQAWCDYAAEVRRRVRLWRTVLNLRQDVGENLWGFWHRMNDAELAQRIEWLRSEIGPAAFAAGWLEPPVLVGMLQLVE